MTDMAMPAFGLVYKSTSKTTGKCYIGQTVKSLEERANGHRKDACSKRRKTAFGAAIRKHSFEDFVWEVIFTAFDRDGLNQAEAALIKYFGTIAPSGYNLKDGGDGHAHHPETLARIAAMNRGRKLSKAHRAKIRAALASSIAFRQWQEKRLGSTMPEGQKLKISAALKGRVMTPEHIAACVKANKKRGTSRKKRAVLLARNRSPDHIAKCAAGRRGKKRSEEQRARMRASRLAYLKKHPNITLSTRGKPWSEARRAAQAKCKSAAANQTSTL